LSKRHSKPKEKGKKVIVKPNAYYKMLVHVLRFGNKAKDHSQFKEVMGMLIGHLEGEGEIKNVIIGEAVPISHGGSIEVDFAPHDYITFATIDEEFAERNWFTVGWYHSHPGLNIFFSSTDIHNQLGWQTPNPSAIGIVFDHSFLENEGDPGFRTFRLDDPSKGPRTDYHEVETIVEPPDDIAYYIKIMDLINSVHSKEPPILEINETPDLFGEIFFPSKKDLLAVKPELEKSLIISSLQNAFSNLVELSIEPLLDFLNNWSQEIIRHTMENNLQMRDDLLELRDNLSSAFDNLQNNFKFTLMNKLDEIDIYIDDRLEGFDTDRELINDLINGISEEVINLLNRVLGESLKLSINKIIEIVDNSFDKLTEVNDREDKFLKTIVNQNESLENLSETVHSIKNKTGNKIREFQENLNGLVKEKYEAITNKTQDLCNEANTFLVVLSSLNMSFEDSLKSLKNKLGELESENKDLISKIQKLEGGRD